MSGPGGAGRLAACLAILIALAVGLAVLFGESAFDAGQLTEAFTDPSSGPAEVLWAVRAPRAMTALMVGAALGLSRQLTGIQPIARPAWSELQPRPPPSCFPP